MSSAVSETAPAPPAPTPEEVRVQLKQILDSREFANAPKKQKFLQLICDAYLAGRAGELNEYMIGYEVFGRSQSYNPALDPIVRVGAHELRKKLERYYGKEGQNADILLEIPVGSYVPIFTRRPRLLEPVELTKAPLSVAALSTRSGIIWISLIGVTLISLLVTVAVLSYSNRQLRQQVKEASLPKQIAEVYQQVWGPFLKAEDPTLLVLSNPAVYRFWNPADPDSLSPRSINLTSAEAQVLEETIGREQLALKHNPLPRLVLSHDEYTGLGEAVGLYRLTSLFKGIGKGVTLKQSRTLSAEDLKNQNVILLGSAWVNEWSGKELIKEDFISGTSGTIINKNPLPGESQEYSAKFDRETGRLVEDYGLITVKPNISQRNLVMVLAGTHSEGTEAAAEYVTSDDRLAYLNQRLLSLEHAPPKYFQALLKVAIDNGIPTTISIVTVHELHSDRQ